MDKTLNHLREIYRDMINHEFFINNTAEQVHPAHFESVKNLLRYLVLRSHDLRRVHDHLSEIGVSSLRSSESYVLHNLISVLKMATLAHTGKAWQQAAEVPSIGYKQARKLLAKNTSELLGSFHGKPKTRIMVTLPIDATEDMIASFLSNGMQIARINLSHGDDKIWSTLIINIKKAEAQLSKKCKIFMDLPGPKLRLGQMPLVKKKRYVKLSHGDHLILSTKLDQAEQSKHGPKGELIRPTRLSFDNKEVIQALKPGERVLFDDGKVACKIVHTSPEEVELVVTRTMKPVIKLKGNKGVNFPDSDLKLNALTDKDREVLPFAMKHADIIGFSFVQSTNDIKTLYKEMDKYEPNKVGVVLKIETDKAVNNLPLMLLESMSKQNVGVMIARGDLKVELGAERISELQDQILWLCEAAHIPVIWATQVLENMAKSGIPTRAEITDASKSSKAECVMLNKGAYMAETIELLRNILRRMEDHNNKKKSVKRQLKIAQKSLKALKLLKS